MSTFPNFPELPEPTQEREPGETYTKFAERRLKEIGRDRRGAISDHADDRKPKPASIHVDAEDAIPQIDYKRTQAQIEIDRLLDDIDVLDAYDRWIGKKREDRRGRDHNIMISCPLPSHPDADPSASVSFRKTPDGVWACHKCQVGGDKYDLAAIHYFGSMDGYKNKEHFPELRLKIAEELGYRLAKSGESEWLEPVSVPVTDPAAEKEGSPASAGVEGVTALGESPDSPSDSNPNAKLNDEFAADEKYPTLDWNTLIAVTPGTFLHEWLSATSSGDEPEEYYLGLGLMALAAAVGNAVKLSDDPLVRANLLMTLVGKSGTGKSIAVNRMTELLRDAFPGRGAASVHLVSGIGSGEELVRQFDIREDDPGGGPKIVIPVNGILDEDEMATLAARLRRTGSTMRQYLMRFFDTPAPIGTHAGGQGAIAENHFFQCITTTQPVALRDLVSYGDAVSGYLNRWTYIFGNIKRMRAIRIPGQVDTSTCIPLIQKVRGWASIVGGRTVTWDADAAAMFTEYFEQRLSLLKGMDDAAMLQRIDLMAKKICLLLAINNHSTRVLPQHVESMTMILEWMIQAYGFVESKIGAIDKAGEAKELILDLLQKNPNKTYTVRQLKQYSRRLRKIDQEASWAVDAAVKSLINQSEIIEVKGDRSVSYMWNPQTPTTSPSQAPQQ